MSSENIAQASSGPVTPDAPAPKAPPAPKPPPAMSVEAPRIDSALAEEMDAAMKSAMAGPSGGSSAKPAPAAVRGPRVVQAGREMRPGKVVSVGPTDIFLEFGPKDLGIVPRLQFPDEANLPKVGDVLEVVVQQRDADGLLVCQRPGTVQKADWELLEPGQIVDAKVVGVNKGGLDLEVAGHRAFMPAGQVSLEHLADLSPLVGEKLTCQVMRVERAGRGNIVLSRKEILQRERKEKAEQIKSSLVEGAVLEGTVRKIMPFGAFVDLGGVDGLVHVGDLTHDRVGHGEKFVQRYVKEGEKIKVQVLKVDLDNNRISLGVKQISADPFATATNEIKEGAEVTGKVTSIAEFGAFLELAPGVEGLVHISELAWKRIGKVEDVLKKDEVVKAKVLKIDSGSRRISLSIKALTEAPASEQRAGDKKKPGRSIEEIQKVTPELRRLREKFGGNKPLRGGI